MSGRPDILSDDVNIFIVSNEALSLDFVAEFRKSNSESQSQFSILSTGPSFLNSSLL